MNATAPVRFSVSQIRVAATCPRILYFDAERTRRRKLKKPLVTRIWKEGGDETAAGGALFHRSIERFNGLARNAREVRELIASTGDAEELMRGLMRFLNRRCIDAAAVAPKPVPLRQAFAETLQRYMRELADIVLYASSSGMSAGDIANDLFGDKRRRVDVTFRVGAKEESVRVVGILDYVFFDWREGRRRIIDYKLTPASEPDNDLFQICTYALMHHHQHDTAPDVALLYLYPERRMIEKSWDAVHAERHKVTDLLASMLEWIRYDETTGAGMKPPGEPAHCRLCRWNRADECAKRLGPKNEGRRYLAETEVSACPTSTTEPATRPISTERDAPKPGVNTPAPTASDPDGSKTSTPSGATANSPSRSTQAAVDAPNEPGIWLGHIQPSGPRVRFDPATFHTHVAVVGAAGSGKTWMAKVLAEEAILKGIPVLAIDPQGDLVQFLRRREPTGFDAATLAAYRQYHAMVEPRVYTPGTSHGIRLSLSPIRLAGVDDMSHLPDTGRRKEEQDAIYDSVAENLVSHAKIGGDAQPQRTLLYRVLKQLCREHADRLAIGDIVKGIMDPDSLEIDDADMILKTSEREKLGRKLYALIQGPSKRLFEGGVPLDLDELVRPHQPGKVPLNIIYLNALTSDDEKQSFVAALASEIYRWMVVTENRPNLLLYLDEAKDYIPAGATKPASKEPLARLFAQGRKYRLGCLLCTQSPGSVDYNVFSNASAKLIGRMESKQDVETIRKWFATSGATPDWIADRKGADTGTFLARWPGMPPQLEGKTIKSRPLFSLHEGAWSPDRLEREMADDPIRQALLSD